MLSKTLQVVVCRSPKLSRAAFSTAWSGDLSFSSPESDFTAPSPLLGALRSAHTQAASWSDTLSFSSPESDFCASEILGKAIAQKSLPRTLQEALLETQQAVVVTTAFAPHRIVFVNHAWEELCEYRQKDVLHKKLDIIQGPQSNKDLAKKVVSKVERTSEEQDCYLINYKKSGTPFTNYLRAGPLYLSERDEKPEFMVGVLEEVDRSTVPIRLVM